MASKKKFAYLVSGLAIVFVGWFFVDEYLGQRTAFTVGDSALSTEPRMLALIETPQDAVFYIGPGWVGGMGSAPVLDESMSRPQDFNGRPIFFDESKVDEVLKQGKMPSCVTGRSEIKVKANITLTSRTGKNYSIPPDRNGRQSEQSYYEAVVNKLYGVAVSYEPCAN